MPKRDHRDHSKAIKDVEIEVKKVKEELKRDQENRAQLKSIFGNARKSTDSQMNKEEDCLRKTKFDRKGSLIGIDAMRFKKKSSLNVSLSSKFEMELNPSLRPEENKDNLFMNALVKTNQNNGVNKNFFSQMTNHVKSMSQPFKSQPTIGFIKSQEELSKKPTSINAKMNKNRSTKQFFKKKLDTAQP